MSTAPLVEHAERYSRLHWALIRANGKEPRDEEWQRTKPMEPGSAAGTWAHYGDRYNMGCVLGPSGLAIFEYDDETAYPTFLELLGGELPATPICRTGSGKLHVYFADPGGLEKKSRDGLELRVGGHQCLVPPSTHPATGKRYAWLEGREPWTVDLLPLPDTIATHFHAVRNGKGAEPVVGLIAEGGRHAALLSLAGTMRRRGMEAAEIFAALKVTNTTRCKPPLKEAEIRDLADDVTERWEPAEPVTSSEPEPREEIDMAEVEAALAATDGDRTARLLAGDKLTWQTLEEVDMRSIVFVDKPLLQASAFHLVAGRKGQGKGTLLAEIAARVTRGELGSKRNVVWIGSEDSAAIDIKPRIVAAGGAPARVLIPKDGPWIQLPRDYDAIRRAMSDFGDVGMLVVDPVGNHISGKNSDGDTDIRDAIGPLNPIADEYECMAFGVRHLSEKDCSRGVLAAILGASAWVHVPRAVLAVARDDEDPAISHVQCVAGNRLPAGTPGRMFRIEGVLLNGLENEVTRAAWIGDSAKDVETMLGNSTGKEPSRSEAARELILDVLDGEGEQESDALDARIASETGIAAKTVQNVRVKLKGDGLVASRPEKDEHGAIIRWFVHRTLAPRVDA